MMSVFLIMLLIIAIFAQRWSRENALKGVSYDAEPSRGLAAPGERFELVTSLTNQSRRFISFVQMEEILPVETVLHAPGALAEKDRLNHRLIHTSTVYLMPRSKRSRRIPMSISARGRHVFPGVRLRGGDFLGLGETRESVSFQKEIVIYPPEAEGKHVRELLGGFLGDVWARRFILEDPVLTAGFREYTGREPMKAISWPKSAQAGRMMVKSFDYTTDPTVTLLLNVELGDDYSTEEKEGFIEACYAIAHTVCRVLEEKGIQYDFYSNAVMYGAFDGWRYIGEGLGERHFTKILEGLGRGSYLANESFEALVRRAVEKKIGSRSTIVITPGSEKEAELFLKRQGSGQFLVISAQRGYGG